MKTCHVCFTECEDFTELCPICGADLGRADDKEEINEEIKENTVKDPVLLATLEDVVSAEIFKDILNENGIAYFCDDSSTEGAMQVLFGGSFIAENIYVDSSDYDTADKLYSEFSENEPEFDDEFFDNDDIENGN